MTFPVPGGATFLRARSNLADVASPAAALADLGGMGLVATTGPAGFNLINGTGSIISWTPPNDGLLHRVAVYATMDVGSLETGGLIQVQYKAPDGGGPNFVQVFGAGLAAGVRTNTPVNAIVQAGQIVDLRQNSALTAGAAVVWAEIWGL